MAVIVSHINIDHVHCTAALLYKLGSLLVHTIVNQFVPSASFNYSVIAHQYDSIACLCTELQLNVYTKEAHRLRDDDAYFTIELLLNL